MNLTSSIFKTRSSICLLIFIVSLICNAETLQGQTLKYENLDFLEALAKAKKSDQLVFVQFDSDCLQCNSMANEGLSGDDIVNIFGKFVCIRVGFKTNDYNKIVSDYRISPNIPTSIIVNSDGNYLASMLNYSTSSHNEYIKLAANAMVNKDNPPFKLYTDALSKEKYDKKLLRQYITKLNENNFNIADLVERYAETLTLKEFEDTTELIFLIRTAPIVNSNIDKLIRNNYELFKKVFESIPYEERVRINRKIIARSKEKAIREKDKNYLYAVSNFLRGTYSKDYKAAQKAESNLQMDFYKAIKDSAQYLWLAKQYYNFNFKALKIDSVCKAEMDQSVKSPDGRIIRGGTFYHTGNQLNNMAFSLLELSSDKEYLGFALKLSEQTLRYNYPPYIDTYAQILYKLGGRKDAIDWQQKAVDLSDSLHQPNIQLKEVLIKMKDGSL